MASIRMLTEYAELERCVDFQRLIWGQGFNDTVPASILWAAQRTGGLVAGAFDDAGVLVGFVFGMTGFVDGVATHWSDMLAVHPRVRGQGIGSALKRLQRDTLLEHGINHVAWTFDPLESRNAFLNFAHLGITAGEYIIDCYGDSPSPLHAGLATDRLIASWALSSDRVRSRMDGAVPPLNESDVADLPLINEGADVHADLTAPRLRLRIPGDIQTLKRVDRTAARAWQSAVRESFLTYFERGYTAVEFVRESPEASCYVLERRAE